MPPIVHSDEFKLSSRAHADRGDIDPDFPVHRKSRGLWQGQPPRTLRGFLWTLMHTARLHRLAVADGYSSSRGWLAAIGKAAEQFYLPKKVPASEFLFTDPKSWNSGEVGRRLDDAGQDWIEFEEPFALLCWPALDVSEYEVNDTNRELGHVKVRTPVVRPIIGDNPVVGPYLFLGGVERSGDGRRWECTKACAQPIVAANCPIPVDSHYERRALRSLRSLVGNLTESGKLKKALGGTVPGRARETPDPDGGRRRPLPAGLPDHRHPAWRLQPLPQGSRSSQTPRPVQSPRQGAPNRRGDGIQRPGLRKGQGKDAPPDEGGSDRSGAWKDPSSIRLTTP